MTETLLLLPLGTYRNGPCCACAASGTSTPSALRQTLPSSAARLAAGRVVATSRVDLPDTNASGADRCRHAPRIVIARLRREGMPRSPRARPPGSPVPRDLLVPASKRTPVYEGTGGIGVDQFRAVGRDGDCRVLRLPRNKTPADQRLAYMKLTASIRGAQDQLVSRTRCNATLAPRSGERVARAQRGPGEGQFRGARPLLPLTRLAAIAR